MAQCRCGGGRRAGGGQAGGRAVGACDDPGTAGVGSALYVTAAMNILARTTPAPRMARAMSLYQGAIMTGTAFGPTIGGLLGHAFSFRTPLYGYAALALLCAIISALALPSRLPE